MLAPVDPATLTANPKFEALYRDLCTNKLNADGTTIPDAKVLKERDAFQDELRNARLEAAKRDILKSELRDLAFRGQALPDELRELVILTTALLEGQIPPEDREVVQEYVDEFIHNADPIAVVLSRNLSRKTSSLAATISPTAPLPPLSIPSSLAATKTALATSQANLAAQRLALATTTTSVQAQQSALLATAIRTLEQTLHGASSRALKARSEHLSLVASGMARKLILSHLQTLAPIYSGEAQGVLKTLAEELKGEERKVRREAGDVEELLHEYGKGGARGVGGLVGEYGEVLREVERVGGEVGRLEGGRIR